MRFVLGFIFNENLEKVLLQLKAKPDWQKDQYNGVGGKVEVNEEPAYAMLREGKEEIGLECNWQMMGTLFVDEHVIYLFRTTLDNPKIEYATRFARNNTPEPLLLTWKDQLPNNVIPNLKYLVPMAASKEIIMTSIIAGTNENKRDKGRRCS